MQLCSMYLALISMPIFSQCSVSPPDNGNPLSSSSSSSSLEKSFSQYLLCLICYHGSSAFCSLWSALLIDITTDCYRASTTCLISRGWHIGVKSEHSLLFFFFFLHQSRTSVWQSVPCNLMSCYSWAVHCLYTCVVTWKHSCFHQRVSIKGYYNC